jgi:uncharacterized protein (UPF0333 family)
MKKEAKMRKSQAVLEYVILFAVVIAAIISVSFFSNIKESLSNHFDYCVEEILK